MLKCLNDGTCIPTGTQISDGSYDSPDATCSCCDGFDGTQCEINQNHTLCLPNPCQNGGRCKLLNGTDSYECECDDDYTGTNCEYSNLCLNSPCEESTTELCLTTSERFACICKPGWGGRDCGDDIDECQDSSLIICLNGGSCVNSPGGYSCTCPPDRTGDDCGKYNPQPVNCSSSQMCLNGGTCVDQEGGNMVCDCPRGFTGDICEDVGKYISLCLSFCHYLVGDIWDCVSYMTT